MHSFGVNSKLTTAKFGVKTTDITLWCEICFDILNRLGVAYQCDRRTDRRMKWPLAIARSSVDAR